MPKILMVTGDGAEALEVMYPYQRLTEEGYQVDIAAPTKKILHSVVHDFEPEWETNTEKLGYRIQPHIAFAEVKPGDYAGLVIPGGRAPEYIRYNETLQQIVKAFFAARKPVAAICHAGQILATAGVVKNRTITVYHLVRSEVIAAGANYVDKEVVVDDHLITSRAWPDHPAFMREFVKLLKSVEKGSTASASR
ncbi:MAG: DJ-1/PfpI family protein [Acidobacteria bacterium]|nr:DJ-1/PfpI family protein [Acidobacteriota bacterium]MCI0717433.1 DJ-1/PfpI family protein [Acidobacteriota bacterium]